MLYFLWFIGVQQVSSVPVKHYSMTRILCTAAWAGVAQCHLVKSFSRNVFGMCQRADLLANSKCAYMNKLYEAAGA